MNKHKLYNTCDIVINELNKSDTPISPRTMGLKSDNKIHVSVIELLLKENIINTKDDIDEYNFISKFYLTLKGLNINYGIRLYLFWNMQISKATFLIPTFISIVALTNNCENKPIHSQENNNTTKRIVAIEIRIDSILKASNDRLYNLCENSTNKLDSLSSKIDSLKIHKSK